MWFVYVIGASLLWALMGLAYRKCAVDMTAGERYVPIKFSIATGVVCVPIVAICLLIREEDFSIWESFVRFYPFTIYMFVYMIVCTISFVGNMYNEASVESPIENLDGFGLVLLSLAFVFFGKAESLWEVLTPRIIVGLALIMIGFTVLAVIREKESRLANHGEKKRFWQAGAGALLVPLLYSFMEAGETVVTGLSVDKTYGYELPEGDAMIILGSVYVFMTVILWLFLLVKEKRPYNPFAKGRRLMLVGAAFDNIGMGLYFFAMAINAVVTDGSLAAYPVLTMILGHIFLHEKLSWKQYVCLVLVIAGAVLIGVEMA